MKEIKFVTPEICYDFRETFEQEFGYDTYDMLSQMRIFLQYPSSNLDLDEFLRNS